MRRHYCQPSHMKAILSSFLSSPFSLHALAKTPLIQTLLAGSSSYHGHRHPVFLASILRPATCGILLHSYAINSAHSFSSVSLGKELNLKDQNDQKHEPLSDDKICQDLHSEVQQAKQARFIPVKTYFLGTSIDLRSLQAQNAYNLYPPGLPISDATNCVMLRYYDVKGDEDLELDSVNEGNCHYMIVFKYGSVVLFNVSDYEADGYLKIVQKHVSALLLEMQKDDYAIVENPTQVAWMQGGVNNIKLKNLTIDGIRAIGNVLGQSIALDYYNRQVDEMIAEFKDINQCLVKTGTFTTQKKKLIQSVGKTNLNMTDVILELRLLERTEIAWKDGNDAQIWEYLRDEYEVTKRFYSLDYKKKFVESNIYFLKECSEIKKSTLLEWLIITLIGVEVLISIFK